MRFFRKEDPAEPVDFWTWWAGARERIATAIDTQTFDARLVEEVSRAVQAVNPDLAWEFGPGATAKHALCVSPEGNPKTRPIALRWLASAPAPDSLWEFHASRQASPTLRGLDIGGQRFDLGEMRAIATWDSSRRRVDVRLWHPGFEAAPEELRQRVCFLFLDNLLGEDEVERWIGTIEPSDGAAGGQTPAELKAEIADRANEPAADTWILGQRIGPTGEAEIVMADAALKHIDHPFAEKHIIIRLPIEGGGMPDNALAEALNREQDRLEKLMEGVATLAGRTTSPGLRAIHFVAEDLDAVRNRIDAWAVGLPEWRIKVELQHDPAWTFQRKLGV